MRMAEECGTVLHRLIREQLCYGNPTVSKTLLAIQHQALQGGKSTGGIGSICSSLENLAQEEALFPQMSARQEPQGQEHQGDWKHSESSMQHLYQLHGEQLPTYEQAKAHSQYLASQKGQVELLKAKADASNLGDLKSGHVRSLSQRLMQLSLQKNASSSSRVLSLSHSYPQLSKHHTNNRVYDSQGAPQAPDQQGPPLEYPSLIKSPAYMVSHSQQHGEYYGEPPSLSQAQHYRYVLAQSQVNWHPAMSDLVVFEADSGMSGAHQIEALLKENERLRRELEGQSEKSTRLTKMETEIQKISEAYEMLMKGSVKQELLERTMRIKLEGEIKRLHDFNRELTDQLKTASKQAANQNQHVITKLLKQNEEQQREREHLEAEVQRLRSAGEEKCRQLEVLEQALRVTQLRSGQLEEELCKNHVNVQRVEWLQCAMAQLHAACEKREMLDQKLCTRLEQEIKSLHMQQGSIPFMECSAAELLQQLREREECILSLEADIIKLEQKYLEERTIRHFVMEAAASPPDHRSIHPSIHFQKPLILFRVAGGLEPIPEAVGTKQGTTQGGAPTHHRSPDQRDTTIINQCSQYSSKSTSNEDLPVTNHKHGEMKNKICAEILEKDKVIEVLQQCLCWEPDKAEGQSFHPARSVPSISPATSDHPVWQKIILKMICTGQVKGKCLSEEQTAAGPPSSCTFLKSPNWDCSSQLDRLPQRAELHMSPEPITSPDCNVQEHPQASKNSNKKLETEVMEILI